MRELGLQRIGRLIVIIAVTLLLTVFFAGRAFASYQNLLGPRRPTV